MNGTSVRELGEEGGDGGSQIRARIGTCFRCGSGRGRARGCGDGLMPCLGRAEDVQESLYATCVLEGEGEGVDRSRWRGARTSMLGSGISCALSQKGMGWES